MTNKNIIVIKIIFSHVCMTPALLIAKHIRDVFIMVDYAFPLLQEAIQLKPIVRGQKEDKFKFILTLNCQNDLDFY